MDNSPEGEMDEMIELYEKKGFTKEDATTIINTMVRCPSTLGESIRRGRVYECTWTSIPHACNNGAQTATLSHSLSGEVGSRLQHLQHHSTTAPTCACQWPISGIQQSKAESGCPS